MTIGKNVHFARRLDLRPPHWLRIGNNVSFGQNVITEANLTVGDDTLISSFVAFVGNDHAFDDPNSTVYWQGRLPESSVVLEGDNLIGFGTIVIGNVTIGRGCIVGSGSVVTKDLPPYTVCAGVPARALRSRFHLANCDSGTANAVT